MVVDDFKEAFGGDDSPQDNESRGSLLPKSLHKALVTGMSAVLMTEEGIRNALGDMRLPKEAISYVVAQTEKSRKDLFSAVTAELKRYLEQVDVASTLRKALVGLKVEVRADIRFVDGGKVTTTVETNVASKDKTEPTDGDEDSEPPASERKSPKRRPPSRARRS